MDVLLTTLNARFQHASFGLRCLRAALGPYRDRSAIREFTINDRPADVVEALLAERPRVIGIGVYIWNAAPTLAVVRLLKRLAPEVTIVLGGPEVSHELDDQPLVALADHVVTGEGERAFAELVAATLEGRRFLTKVIAGGLPDLATLPLPYDEYTDADLAHRLLYVEASRGCPYRCEFCLSSLDTKVRAFPLEALLAAFDRLIARGARAFKFVDRTFNLSPRTSLALLDFFLARQDLGVFAHFEMVPDRFPDELRDRLARFPPGRVQLEVGIQTFDAATEARISRPQDHAAIERNLRFLADHTGAHVHADLIIGLPGEDAASFGRGFDRLVALGAHEIQVGLLKRLRGTPIIRHDAAFGVVWNPEPPYDLLANDLIPFAELQRLKRFARVWDLVVNRGQLPTAVRHVWGDGSPFHGMLALTDFIAARASLGGIALARLATLVFEFLVEIRGIPRDDAGAAVAADLVGPGRRVPAVLAPYVTAIQRAALDPSLPARQARHHRALAERDDPPHDA